MDYDDFFEAPEDYFELSAPDHYIVVAEIKKRSKTTKNLKSLIKDRN